MLAFYFFMLYTEKELQVRNQKFSIYYYIGN